MTTESKRKFLIDFAFFLVITAIIYLVFKFLSGFLLPFVIGIFVSFIVQRPVRAIKKHLKISKGFITIVFVILTYFLVVAALSLVVFLIYRWLTNVATLLPQFIPTVSNAISNLNTTLAHSLDNLPEFIVEFLSGMPEKLISTLTSAITSIISSFAANVATATPAIIISTIVTIVASCYIAKDYDTIINFAQQHIQPKVWSIIIDIKELFVKSIFRMLRGYLLLMLITFIELSIGFWIIGHKNFIMLGAIICVVDILPVLGTGTVVIPWAIVSLATGNILNAIGLLLIYVVITVVRNFLEPKVIGEQVGLHPLITLISIFCGYQLIGFMGIFLFPLTLICINDLRKRGKINLWNNKRITEPQGKIIT